MLLSVFYVFAITVSIPFGMVIGANSNVDGSKKFLGCYMDQPAPMASVHCEETLFGGLKEQFVVLPQIFFMVSFFGLFEITSIPLVLLLWCPLFYLIWYAIKGRHRTRN